MSNNSIKPQQKKILLAEDDPGILDAMEIMLEINGYDVITTDNGSTIQNMKEDFPDLLLLDIWLSGMDGKAICKHLKSQELTKQIPIILVSASKDLERSARDAGADDFIAKPFEMDDLLKKVKKHTSH